MRDNSIIFVSILLFSIATSGCEKDDLKQGKAEALPSFEGKWEFEDATFSYDNNDQLSINFNHHVEDSEVIIRISFRNIAPTEGTSIFVFQTLGAGLAIGKPSSYARVLIGDDALAESYVIDSTSSLINMLKINSISNHKVEGEFQASYTIGDYPFPKGAPWIPDQFSFTEGSFHARE